MLIAMMMAANTQAAAIQNPPNTIQRRLRSEDICAHSAEARHHMEIASGVDQMRHEAVYAPKLSQNWRALAKKPSDSGLLFRASRSNSRNSSRWRRVRLTGVSTVTWMY